jgi:hypothetical protein
MLITNFASGELSPLLSGRVDLQQYYAGASLLKNWDVIPTGGIRRRCGTKRIGKLTAECRLIPFILNKDISFVFECVPGKMYVWKNGSRMLASDGTQVCITSPWQSLDEIREIQYAQNYNRMIFVQESCAPFEIVYNEGTGAFTYGSMSFDFIPDVKLDDDYGYIVTVTGSTMNAGTFDGQYCVFHGRLYKWSAADVKWSVDTSADDPETDDELFTTDNKYPSCVTFFQNRLWFASTKNNRQKVWASAAPDTEGDQYNVFSTYVKYVTVEKVVKNPDMHVFSGDVDVVSDADGTAVYDGYVLYNLTQNYAGRLEGDAADYYCSGDIIGAGTKVVELLTMTGTLLSYLSAYKTWYEGGKSGDEPAGLTAAEKNHYKKLSTLTEGTYAAVIDTGATENYKSAAFTIQLWRLATAASADDYEYDVVNNNMVTSDCAFYFELASDQNDAVKWMAPSSQLIVGTESSEWVIPASVTALAVQAVLNSRHGTDSIQAMCVDSAVVFFAQGREAVREYYWNDDAGAFRANNLAMGSSQMLTGSPAVDFDFMTNPFCRLLVTRKDGTMAVMLYEKSSGVAAWFRFVTDGTVSSCAVVRGEAGCDIIYLAVERNGVWYLEKYDETGSVYLDSFSGYTGTDGYGADAVIWDETQGVQYALDEGAKIAAGDAAYIGYPYESVLTSMPVTGSDPTGKKRITDLKVRFYNSYRPVLVCSNKVEEFVGMAEPFSGVQKITYPGQSGVDVQFTITASKPRPCTILAVNAELAQ